MVTASSALKQEGVWIVNRTLLVTAVIFVHLDIKENQRMDKKMRANYVHAMVTRKNALKMVDACSVLDIPLGEGVKSVLLDTSGEVAPTQK